MNAYEVINKSIELLNSGWCQGGYMTSKETNDLQTGGFFANQSPDELESDYNFCAVGSIHASVAIITKSTIKECGFNHPLYSQAHYLILNEVEKITGKSMAVYEFNDYIAKEKQEIIDVFTAARTKALLDADTPLREDIKAKVKTEATVK